MANAPLTFPNGNPFKQGKKPAPAKKPGFMDALRAADILGLSEDNAVMKRLRAREAASKGK